VGRKFSSASPTFNNFDLNSLFESFSRSEEELKEMKEAMADPRVQFVSTMVDGLQGLDTGSCSLDLGICLSKSVLMALQDPDKSEGFILSQGFAGVQEYMAKGSINNTWRQLREIDHVENTSSCLKAYKLCM